MQLSHASVSAATLVGVINPTRAEILRFLPSPPPVFRTGAGFQTVSRYIKVFFCCVAVYSRRVCACARAHLRPLAVYLTEGYSQPISLLSKARITNLRVWVAALNPAVKVLISQHIIHYYGNSKGGGARAQKDAFIGFFSFILTLLCFSLSLFLIPVS